MPSKRIFYWHDSNYRTAPKSTYPDHCPHQISTPKHLVGRTMSQMQTARLINGCAFVINQQAFNHGAEKTVIDVSGQDSQYDHMGRDLFETEPAFRHYMLEMDRVVVWLTNRGDNP